MQRLFFVLLMACAIVNGYFAMQNLTAGNTGWGLFSSFWCLYALFFAAQNVEFN